MHLLILLALPILANAEDLTWLNGFWVGDVEENIANNDFGDEITAEFRESLENYTKMIASLEFREGVLTSYWKGEKLIVSTYFSRTNTDGDLELIFNAKEYGESIDLITRTTNGFCMKQRPYWINVELPNEIKRDIRKHTDEPITEGWTEINPVLTNCFKRGSQ